MYVFVNSNYKNIWRKKHFKTKFARPSNKNTKSSCIRIRLSPMQWMLILNWGAKEAAGESWSRVLSVTPLSKSILSKWYCQIPANFCETLFLLLLFCFSAHLFPQFFCLICSKFENFCFCWFWRKQIGTQKWKVHKESVHE